VEAPIFLFQSISAFAYDLPSFDLTGCLDKYSSFATNLPNKSKAYFLLMAIFSTIPPLPLQQKEVPSSIRSHFQVFFVRQAFL
jgi:hypothetical protein